MKKIGKLEISTPSSNRVALYHANGGFVCGGMFEDEAKQLLAAAALCDRLIPPDDIERSGKKGSAAPVSPGDWVWLLGQWQQRIFIESGLGVSCVVFGYLRGNAIKVTICGYEEQVELPRTKSDGVKVAGDEAVIEDNTGKHGEGITTAQARANAMKVLADTERRLDAERAEATIGDDGTEGLIKTAIIDQFKLMIDAVMDAAKEDDLVLLEDINKLRRQLDGHEQRIRRLEQAVKS